MESKKISPDRWQALYGPVPQNFDLLVQQTLKKTREAPVMKRLTLRTGLVLLLCLLLLTGIALAATGVFSTKNSLDMYTSVPSDGSQVDMQTNLHQTGGDFPDLSVKVRDAVFDGVTAFVTVEYKLKNPEKDMILSIWDAEFEMKDVGRWKGFSMVPLTDPKTDPRRKLVINNGGALVYGLYNYAIAEHIYESDGVLLLTWRIRMDSDQAFDAGYTWETRSGVYDSNKAAYYKKTIENVLHRIAGNDPLELTLITECQKWDGDIKIPGKGLYFCNVEITLNKGPAPVIRYSKVPIIQGDMTLTNAMFTFTKLATYMDLQTEFSMGIGTRPDGDGELGPGLAFEWLDDQGNVIPCLGETSCGTYDNISIGSKNFELNRYTAFWPAVDKIPDTLTLRAYSNYTDERLATFTVPLTNMPAPSPALFTEEPQGTFPVIQILVPSPSPVP